jgi:hypothetical protein
MKKIITKSVFLAAFLSLGALQAQQSPKAFGRTVQANPENGLVRCVSSEYYEYQKENNIRTESRGEFESWLKEKIVLQKAQRDATGTAAVITIPVVVHVIHNGDAVGSNENIANAQVISQITVLNQDYRRMLNTPGYNEAAYGADVEIEFCLAKVDPNGNPTNGIDRQDMGQSSWNSESSIENTLKPTTIWDPTKYFNIWVCNFGGGMSDTLGYAQFPTTSVIGGIQGLGGGASTDGVIIGYRYFGSQALYPQGQYAAPYNRGRTATHEIGHCLGLIHIWGDSSSCTVNATDSFKDYCPDTPAANEANYGCSYSDSCTTSPDPDMIENYMDYSDDACMNVFTEDQKERMVAVMNNAVRRKSLKTSTVCQEIAGADDFNLLKDIGLYPNPAQSVLNINVADGDLPDSFTIYNSLGQTMSTVKVNGSVNLTINISAYANGVYFVKVDKGAQTKTLKFVKN